MEHTLWWKNAVVYQIYPRSFCDSNNDGIGDINGIISKLDYLKELGINAIWLSPIFDSPQKDNGYDISNYRDIYPPFGTLTDFKNMLSEMHKRGIKLIMDLVVNHTSNEHPWFKSAYEDINSPYRDYYIIKKGKNNGHKPPNNWTSFFGGSAWERIKNSDEYYLHLFAKEQPDLNWENPKVRKEVIDIIRYWLDMGVDGFREDVITLISKKQDFKSSFPSLTLTGKNAYRNGPRLHEYLKYLYDNAFTYYDTFTVGEATLCSLKEAQILTNPDNHELDTLFNFSHTDVDNYFGFKFFHRKFNLVNFKKAICKSQYAFKKTNGWNSLFIENHDQRRSIGRFGTDGSTTAAKMLATCYMLLKGTPFIYEGQEIGMSNVNFEDINDYRDIEFLNMVKICEENKLINKLIGKNLKNASRDNARTPMQWDDSQYAGFSKVEPWMKVNPNKNFINVKNSLSDSDSLFHYYQKLINLRLNNEILKDGEFIIADKENKNIFSYFRILKGKSILVITSFSNKSIDNFFYGAIKVKNILLNNYPGEMEAKLLPYQALVIECENYFN